MLSSTNKNSKVMWVWCNYILSIVAQVWLQCHDLSDTTFTVHTERNRRRSWRLFSMYLSVFCDSMHLNGCQYTYAYCAQNDNILFAIVLLTTQIYWFTHHFWHSKIFCARHRIQALLKISKNVTNRTDLLQEIYHLKWIIPYVRIHLF